MKFIERVQVSSALPRRSTDLLKISVSVCASHPETLRLRMSSLTRCTQPNATSRVPRRCPTSTKQALQRDTNAWRSYKGSIKSFPAAVSTTQ